MGVFEDAILLFIVGLIVKTFEFCARVLGDTITFRKALKKQMVRAVPELEQPKTKEDAVAMGQVFEEIGFFDYVAEHTRNRNICLLATVYLLFFSLFYYAAAKVVDTTPGEVLSRSILTSLLVALIPEFCLFMDFRQTRGIIQKCRNAEAISKCSEEDCVSYFQKFYTIYKDYRQRFLGDQDRQR